LGSRLHFSGKCATLRALKLPGKPGVLLEVLFFMSRFTSLKLVLTGFLLTAVLASGLVQAKGPAAATPSETMTVAELPRQGAQVYGLIYQGGPFAHEKDGVVFGNRERLLPIQKRGYYHEYTVATPGSRDRGVRRIVCGGSPRTPDTCYYTADHYASFRRIVP
jgi:ribonuclease T1